MEITGKIGICLSVMGLFFNDLEGAQRKLNIDAVKRESISWETLRSALPKLQVEENEGSALARYHVRMRAREVKGPSYYFCYMPYDKAGFEFLHSLYLNNILPPQFVSRRRTNDALEMVEDQIISNICSELYYRTLDKRTDLLDKYLENFSVFVSLMDESKDTEFVSRLCSRDEISSNLFSRVLSLNNEVEKGALLKRDLLYLVVRLDKIMESSRVFKGIGLLDSCKRIIAGSFMKSAEYKSMCEMIEQMFSKGVRFDFWKANCASTESASEKSTEEAANVSKNQTKVDGQSNSEKFPKSKSANLVQYRKQYKKLSVIILKKKGNGPSTL